MSHRAENGNGKGKITVVEERLLANQVIIMEALEGLCLKVDMSVSAKILSGHSKETRNLLEVSEVTTPRDVIGFSD